jgi:DNA mismatch repair protein MutS2
MQERTLKALEYYKILEKIAHFASSKTAVNEIMNMKPLTDLAEIEQALNEVEEADKILFKYTVTPSFSFDDIAFALERASKMSILTMGELLKIGHVLQVARNLQTQIVKVPDDSIDLLKQMASEIYINKKIEEDIDKAIISETEMSDDASPDLKIIRRKIRKIGENIKARLNNFVNSPTYSKYIQDNIVTIRNDRYVIPVKSECKGSIPGLVHDQSSSGATLYVEPMVIVEMNNELKINLIQEQQEIERILREFTFIISNECGLIKYTFDVITKLDIIFAKAYYGNSIEGVKPTFNNKGYVNIEKGRHPLITKDKVVSNTIYVGDKFNMLFITGPNTGGKTVCLKLLGIIQLMGMSGMFVPAISANLANFDNICCDIGDEQSIEQNLSTFSGHMSNVVNIIDSLTPNTLVLFDELGAGTDPAEGASLAVSISDYILSMGAKAVITTHYNELKEYAVVIENTQNASMDFDPNLYAPTYHLIIGTPGASNALLIARKLGLKEEIIEKAKEGISSQKFEFENIVLSLEKARKEADTNLIESQLMKKEISDKLVEIDKEREKLYSQRERLNVSVRKETKRLVEDAMSEANEIIEELRNLLDEPDESTVFKAQKLRKSLKKYVINEENEFQGIGEELEGDIIVGDHVLIKTLNSEGEVIQLNPVKREAKVKLGAIITTVKIDNLQRLQKTESKSNKKKTVTVPMQARDLYSEQVPTEINLIGLNREEAINELQIYIDKCIRVGMHESRIIHGHGEGILRNAVQGYLKTRNEIELYRNGNFYEGGKGATYVLFK